MTSLARHAVRHPRLWMALVATATLVAGSGLLRLELRTEGSVLYPSGNSAVDASEADRIRFEEPRHIVVLVGCRNDGVQQVTPELGLNRGPAGCLASPEGFRFLRRIHDELEALPGIRRDGVQSVAGLTEISRREGTLSLRRYLDEVPDDPVAFAELESQVRRHPLTNGLLLSLGGRLASFFVPLAENRPVTSLIEELEEWRTNRAPQPAYELRLTGPQIAEATLGRMVLRDLSVLVPMMLIVIALLLYLTFGNLGGVLIPLAESGVVLLFTFGAMGWLGAPVTLVTTILPVVLMAMSITDEIHLLERVREQPPGQTRAEAVLGALAEVGRPIVLTSLTTAFGFLSFLSASLPPLRDFGLFAAFGILLAMLLTFCWIPALIVLLPESWLARPAEQRFRAPAFGLDRLAEACIRRPSAALAAGTALLLLALPGVFLLRVQDSWVGNFDSDSELVEADRDFNRAFWGSYRFDVVFEAVPDFFYSSAGAALLESFEQVALRAPHVGGVESHLTVLREVARALGETRPLSQLPEMAAADLAMLAELSRERMSLRQVLSDAGDAARARLYVGSADHAKSLELRAELDRRFSNFPLPDFVEVRYSGDLPLALEVVSEIVYNQLRSIGWALISVAVLLGIFFARGASGLLVMIPVAAATAFLFGSMGLLGVPLGIATSMFASLTVGVGVDFGIHFLHRYRFERRAGRSDDDALRATVVRTGRALRWNALVLAFGFLVLALSSLKPNHSLGFLLAGAMLSCYAATLLFLPRLARLLPGVLLLVLGASAAAPIARAQADSCAGAPDPAARAIMAGLERDLRGRTHIAHLEISTRYRKRHPLARPLEQSLEPKRLWAVFASDEQETWTLYVFSGPGRLAGTSLLMRDRIAGTQGDEMWLYLRAFETFTPLESTARRRTLVPGTVFTYEDARGFIPLDKYEFSFRNPRYASDGATADAEVLACPRTPELARDLGYGSLRISVDTAKRLVRAVEYRDLADAPLKRYRVEEDQQIGEGGSPRRVLLEHLANGTTTPIEYEYWLPPEAPPKSLFAPSVEEEPFLPRLERYLAKVGIHDRIAPELREADATVRAWEERWGGRVPTPDAERPQER